MQAQSPYFEILKTIKNKNNYQNTVIFQDSKGYIWFGSSVELTRYDGLSFTSFTTNNGLSENIITALAEDQSGNIWIGHKNGKIDRMNKDGIYPFNPEEGLGEVAISSIVFDKKGNLWFSTLGEGVYCFKGANKHRLYNLNADDGLNDNFAYNMVVAPDSSIYVGTDNGISIIDPYKGKVTQHLSMKDGLPDNIVKHLYFDQTGTLWIGMEDFGLCSYYPKYKSFQTITGWDFGSLNSFIERRPGEFWISTVSNGIVKLVMEKSGQPLFKQYKTNQGLHCNRTQEIYLDREQNVWIGCQDGITKASANRFEFLDKRDGFNLQHVFNFIVDKKGNYWVVSETGLFRYQLQHDGSFLPKKVNTQKKIANSFVCLYEDVEGFIWAGTYGFGVYRINPEDLSSLRFGANNGLSNDNVISISGKNNQIWFSTLGGGAVLCTIGKTLQFETFDQSRGLSGNYVYSVYTDSRGNTWFAHDGAGFSLMQNGVIKKSFLPDSLNENTIYSIIEDLAGNMWFLTAHKGLLKYNGTTFTSLDES
jgi:ligand-binding sensor domain-containing protein